MKLGPELVSVVVAAYNAAPFIARTLASALAQTHQNLEVLVVEDGSTDATAAIVTAIARRDRRLRLIRQPNAGVAAARNRGIAEARGELVAVLDADDLWHPDKLRLQVACLHEAGPETAIAYCWNCTIDPEDRIILAGRRPRLEEGQTVLQALLHYNFIMCASAPLMRMSALQEVGGYDPSLRARGGEGCEDKELYLRLAERYRFGVVPAVLVAYRTSPGSMSHNVWQMRRSNDLILRDVRARHPHLPQRWFDRGACRGDLGAAARLLRSFRFGGVAGLLWSIVRRHPVLCGREILSRRGLSFLHRQMIEQGMWTRRVGPKLDWLDGGDEPVHLLASELRREPTSPGSCGSLQP